MQLYSIEGGFDEGDVQDFLMRVALLKGKLGKVSSSCTLQSASGVES